MKFKQKRYIDFLVLLVTVSTLMFIYVAIFEAKDDSYKDFLFGIHSQIFVFAAMFFLISNPKTLFFFKSNKILRALGLMSSAIEVREFNESEDNLSEKFKQRVGIFIRNYRVSNGEIFKISKTDEIPFYIFDNKTNESIFYENVSSVIKLNNSTEICILYYDFEINKYSDFGKGLEGKKLMRLFGNPFKVLFTSGNFILADFQKRLHKLGKGEENALEEMYLVPKLKRKHVVFKNEKTREMFLKTFEQVNNFKEIKIHTD